jgi:metallo-beta-lactamase class B
LGAAERPGAESPPPPPRWERPPELAASARLFESWKPAVPPRTLLGNIHYVGTSGIAAYLITTPAGHILIDTGFDDTADQLLASIEQLGFRPADIRLLLSSHAHVDHVGGHARVQQRTGAQVIASAADARVLASGGADDFSPFPLQLMRYPPVTADRIVTDGETVSLGGVTLTAHLTPGHTAGATTWSTTVRHAGREYAVVFLSSLSLVSGTRLLGNPRHPNLVADYEQAFRRLATMSCDAFFGFHVSPAALATLSARLDQLQSGLGPNPFHDGKTGWQAQLTTAERAFREQLAAERQAGTALPSRAAN